MLVRSADTFGAPWWTLVGTFLHPAYPCLPNNGRLQPLDDFLSPLGRAPPGPRCMRGSGRLGGGGGRSSDGSGPRDGDWGEKGEPHLRLQVAREPGLILPGTAGRGWEEGEELWALCRSLARAPAALGLGLGPGRALLGVGVRNPRPPELPRSRPRDPASGRLRL